MPRWTDLTDELMAVLDQWEEDARREREQAVIRERRRIGAATYKGRLQETWAATNKEMDRG